MMKALSVLGSTGCIGRQTLSVAKAMGFRIVALSTNKNIDLLYRQINEFSPTLVCVYDKEKAMQLSRLIDVPIVTGMAGLKKIAQYQSANMVVNALVGAIGILPTIAAMEMGKTMAIANKETLVSAGLLVMTAMQKYGGTLIPIDSEHSAIFQCLQGEDRQKIAALTLTCSGGPFLNWSLNDMKEATKEDALNHPVWSMGKKISIDSATLMNKAFEIIQAHILFGIDYDKIHAVIHPQAIVHSFVTFVDGNTKAQLSSPSMEMPIQYALTYPDRIGRHAQNSPYLSSQTLTFDAVDAKRFPALKLGYDAGGIGGSMPAVLSAANEECVNAFLADKIGLMDIVSIIKKMMGQHKVINNPTLEEILTLDQQTRLMVKKIIGEG